MGPGQIFEEQYRIIEEIGRGSYGIVYRVEDIHTQEVFALKLLLPWAENDATACKRFEREAAYSQRFDHPSIVSVKRHGHTADGKPFLLMEYVAGQALDKVLRTEQRLSIDRATRIARQVILALAEAHEQGIIHRDLKPDNLVLCPRSSLDEECVKVFDFGIAKEVDGTSDLASVGRLTMTGTTLGTVDYMSPEQVEGEDLTPSSDFYSLGVVLYEMVTGRLPYESRNPVELMIMHSSAPVPTLPQSIARTPLGAAITKALQKQPQDRPANCQEFLALLDAPPTPPASETKTSIQTLPASSRSLNGMSYTLKRLLAKYWLAIVIAILLLVLIISQW